MNSAEAMFYDGRMGPVQIKGDKYGKAENIKAARHLQEGAAREEPLLNIV